MPRFDERCRSPTYLILSHGPTPRPRLLDRAATRRRMVMHSSLGHGGVDSSTRSGHCHWAAAGRFVRKRILLPTLVPVTESVVLVSIADVFPAESHTVPFRFPPCSWFPRRTSLDRIASGEGRFGLGAWWSHGFPCQERVSSWKSRTLRGSALFPTQFFFLPPSLF